MDPVYPDILNYHFRETINLLETVVPEFFAITFKDASGTSEIETASQLGEFLELIKSSLESWLEGQDEGFQFPDTDLFELKWVQWVLDEIFCGAIYFGHVGIVRAFLEPRFQPMENYDALFVPQVCSILQNGLENIADLQLQPLVCIDKIRGERTALMLAAESGQKAIFRLLLDQNIDINVTNRHGVTATMFTAGNNHRDLTRMLLDKGANIDYVCGQGLTALTFAAYEGREGIVKMLLGHKKPGGVNGAIAVNSLTAIAPLTPSDDEALAFMLAVQNGYEETVTLFLDEKLGWPDLISTQRNNLTPLMSAVLNRHQDIAQMLIDRGADVNGVNRSDETALLHAAYHGHLHLIDLLLKNGANINATDHVGSTILMRVINNNPEIDVVKFLLTHGADPNKANDEGETALMYAVEGDEPDLIQLLIDHKADIDAANRDGWTVLMYAIMDACTVATSLLLEHKVNIDASNSEGATALSLAIENNDSAVIEILVGNGVVSDV